MSALLSLQDVRIRFETRNGIVKAVNGVSFDVESGQTVGIVGESGSGKSVLCQSLMHLFSCPPGVVEGRALYKSSIDLFSLKNKEIRSYSGSKISMIFQDPMSALNPYLKVGDQVSEPLKVHAGLSNKEAWDKAIEALEDVGIPDAAHRAKMYPHEFSGGMQQRVVIAMAMISRPELLIADEPTTALDVTVQAQVLELLRKEQEKTGVAVILITHDLGVVRQNCETLVVMYGGQVMEKGPVRSVLKKPSHPYTAALKRSMPTADVKGQDLHVIPGSPPDPRTLGNSCPFFDRCVHSAAICSEGIKLKELENQQFSACVRIQMGEISLEEL